MQRRTTLDRRYLTGCVAGLLLGGALGVPCAYALLRLEGNPTRLSTPRAGALASQRSSERMAAAGLRALAAREHEQALALFLAAEQAGAPRDARLQNNICVALNELGRHAEAVDACQRALAIEPGLALARNNLAWARARLRDAAPGGDATAAGR